MPLPVLSGQSTVTMPINDYYEIERLVSTLRAEVEAKHIATVKPKSESTQELHAALRTALTIVQFAVGNLPPESTRGWPHEALAALSAALMPLASIEPEYSTLGLTLRVFAAECLRLDQFRATRAAVAAAIVGTPAPVPAPSTEIQPLSVDQT